MDTEAEDKELREETLLQLLAIFIRRFGGEVEITQREFDMVEGLPIVAHQFAPGHLRLYLDEGYYFSPDDIPGEMD